MYAELMGLISLLWSVRYGSFSIPVTVSHWRGAELAKPAAQRVVVLREVPVPATAPIPKLAGQPKMNNKENAPTYRKSTKKLSVPMLAIPCFSRRTSPMARIPVSKIAREIR